MHGDALCPRGVGIETCDHVLISITNASGEYGTQMGGATDLAVAFSRKTVAMILAAVLVAYALAVAFLVDIARIHDEKALTQTTQFVRLLIQQERAAVERTVGDYADWGAAYEHLHKTVDRTWAYDQDNVGLNLLKDLGIEYAGVFDPHGNEVYSVIDGQLMTPPAIGRMSGVGDIVTRAQAMGTGGAASGLLIADGDPVFAAARVLSPGADPSVKDDGRGASVLLFADRLTESELAQIRASLGLPRLRLVEVDLRRTAARDVFLRASDGKTGFALDVTAPTPGREILRAIVPSFVAVGAAFAAFLLWLGRQGLRDAGVVHNTHRTLKQTAHYDAITGLPNRALFTQRLQEVLSRSTPASVLFLDLDRFKPINDTFGHDAGDFVLREVGKRLQDTIRPGDLCARLGGDEFVILAFDQKETALHRLCKDIIRAISVEIPFHAHVLNVGVSIGIAETWPGQDSLDDVLRRADRALYDAKTSGRSRYRWSAETPPSERVSA